MNVIFYQNRYSPPGAALIEDILKWDDNKLESCHCYIQWLFPLMDEKSRFNMHAPLITESETKAIRENVVSGLRVFHAFERMLMFFGFRLCHETQQVILESTRRLQFLNTSWHNFLRITRILKSMMLLGLESFQDSFLNSLCDQVMNGHLWNAKQSMQEYWIPTRASRVVSDVYAKEYQNGTKAYKLIFESDKKRQLYIFGNLAWKVKCGYAIWILQRLIRVFDLPWSLMETWFVLTKRNDEYVLMNCASQQLKLAPPSVFTFLYCEEGEELRSDDFAGLWVWDRLEWLDDVHASIDHCLENAYASGQLQISGVFLK